MCVCDIKKKGGEQNCEECEDRKNSSKNIYKVM